MIAAIVSEEKEREKQKLNLIVHNFPESKSTEVGSQKKNEDTQNGVDAHIINATQIGKQTGGPRLMKVITPNLTLQHQAKNKQLHARLSELNKSEKINRIKNRKIVRRDEA